MSTNTAGLLATAITLGLALLLLVFLGQLS